MTTPLATLYDWILGVHISAVVVGFGVTFAYGLMGTVGRRLDPRAMPWLHRMQVVIAQRLINPALTVILLAGVYLASDGHHWHDFFVQWGIGVVLVLGGLEGAVIMPRERRLAQLAERDVAAAGAGEVRFGDDYEATFRQVAALGILADVLVLATIFVMAVKP